MGVSVYWCEFVEKLWGVHLNHRFSEIKARYFRRRIVAKKCLKKGKDYIAGSAIPAFFQARFLESRSDPHNVGIISFVNI